LSLPEVLGFIRGEQGVNYKRQKGYCFVNLLFKRLKTDNQGATGKRDIFAGHFPTENPNL